MSIRLGVVMDPISKISPKKDSTLAMLLSAKKLGWELFYMEQNSLFLDNGIPKASIQEVSVFDDLQQWYHLSNSQVVELNSLDVILMRKDPPFDNEYIYSTYILEAAERSGVKVINKPQSLRDCNEKFFATQFPECCAPHLVTCSAKHIKAFTDEHQDIILKPLDGMGGSSIFRHRAGDPNLSVIVEVLTAHGQNQVMAQKYIPEIVSGDKRIILIDGEAQPFCLARIPAPGETRGNIAAGGAGKVQALTDRDHWLCQQIGPVLKEKGLTFVGLDVIGDYVTEINVTSPTCIREIEAGSELKISDTFIKTLAEKVNV